MVEEGDRIAYAVVRSVDVINNIVVKGVTALLRSQVVK